MTTTLVFFKQGSSAELLETLKECRGKALVYPLQLGTSDDRFVHDVVADAGRDATVLDLHSVLGQGDRYVHLDDYAKAICAWSEQKSPVSGKSLREELCFAGEVSGWWLLPFTEKMNGTEAVELFRTIYVLDETFSRPEWRGAPPERAVFLGDPESSKIHGEVARRFGMDFIHRKVAQQSSAPSGSARHLFSAGQGVAEAWLKRWGSRRPVAGAKGPIVVFSDYPQAWELADGLNRDRYLDHIVDLLGKTYGQRLILALDLDAGPVVLPGNASRLHAAFEFSRAIRRQKPRITVDVLDRVNSLSDRLRTQRWGVRLATTLPGRIHQGEFGSIRYRGVELTGYFSGLIERGLRGQVPRLLARGLNASRYLKAVGASACVYRNEFYCSGRALSWASARSRVPSLGVQHGIINSKYGVYQFDPSELQADLIQQDQVRRSPAPTRFGVWGDWYRKRITDHAAYPLAGLPVIGAHRLSALLNPGKLGSREAVRTRFGLGTDSLVLVFTVQDIKTLEGIALVVRAALAYQGPRPLELVFKMHHFHRSVVGRIIHGMLPPETLADGAQERASGVRFHFRGGNLVELIAASDAVVTCYSCTGIESLLLNRPVIAVQLPTMPGDHSFRDFGPEHVFEVSDLQGFLQAIEKVRLREGSQIALPFPHPNQQVLSLDDARNDQVLIETLRELSDIGQSLKSR